jgi:hypothetical protein
MPSLQNMDLLYVKEDCAYRLSTVHVDLVYTVLLKV